MSFASSPHLYCIASLFQDKLNTLWKKLHLSEYAYSLTLHECIKSFKNSSSFLLGKNLISTSREWKTIFDHSHFFNDLLSHCKFFVLNFKKNPMHRNKKRCSGVRAKLLDDHHQNQNVAPTKFSLTVTRAKRATLTKIEWMIKLFTYFSGKNRIWIFAPKIRVWGGNPAMKLQLMKKF